MPIQTNQDQMTNNEKNRSWAEGSTSYENRILPWHQESGFLVRRDIDSEPNPTWCTPCRPFVLSVVTNHLVAWSFQVSLLHHEKMRQYRYVIQYCFPFMNRMQRRNTWKKSNRYSTYVIDGRTHSESPKTNNTTDEESTETTTWNLCQLYPYSIGHY